MKNTFRAIKNYGVNTCIKAHRIHNEYGEGASSIAFGYDLGRPMTSRQVNAAIEAGWEIYRVQSKARGTTFLTDDEEQLLYLVHAARLCA